MCYLLMTKFTLTQNEMPVTFGPSGSRALGRSQKTIVSRKSELWSTVQGVVQSPGQGVLAP